MPNIGKELVEKALENEHLLIVEGHTHKQCVNAILQTSPRFHWMSQTEKRCISQQIDACLKEAIRDGRLYWKRAHNRGRLKVGLVRPDEEQIDRKEMKAMRLRGYTPSSSPNRRIPAQQRHHRPVLVS